MSGREFVAMWAAVIGFTALVVGWAFLCVYVLFPRQPAAALTVGVGTVLVIVIGGTWLAVRS